MNHAFHTFHRGLIDYAGLFPPAGLALDVAMSHFQDYIGSVDAWMLGSFVLPVSQVPALEAILGGLTSERTKVAPMSFSVLPKPIVAEGDVDEGLRGDLRRVCELMKRYPEWFNVESFELRLPPVADSAALIENVMKVVDEEGFSGRKVYFECDPAALNEVIVTALRGCEGAFYKLRCGGVEASAYPAPESVMQVIQQCRHGGVGMKFTAGLHHPLRHYSDAVGCKEFGFINAFGAVMLAGQHDLADEAVLSILTEEDSSAFKFDDQGFHWRGLSIDEQAVGEIRNSLCHSYGSCSFEEPRDDLKDLGWMV